VRYFAPFLPLYSTKSPEINKNNLFFQVDKLKFFLKENEKNSKYHRMYIFYTPNRYKKTSQREAF